MNETTLSLGETPVIVGVSTAIQEVLDLVDRVACSRCCVLIEGESGTGKELIARRLWARGDRQEQPFIPVNCAGISETLFESQFFGHVRGAFTGAEQNMLGVVRTADGGTVFLDEVSEIPLTLQPKLLRVLQEQEVMPVGRPIPIKVDTRFIAGTNRNLADMVRRGEFRRDLYHRLNIVRIVLPPLRERSEDVLPLLEHFACVFADRYRRKPIRAERRDPIGVDRLRLAGQRPRVVRLGRAALRHRADAGSPRGDAAERDGNVLVREHRPRGEPRPRRAAVHRQGVGASELQQEQGGQDAAGASSHAGPKAEAAQPGIIPFSQGESRPGCCIAWNAP